MQTRIQIPAALRECCAGASELTVPAATVRDVLAQLEQTHPSLYRSVCDETGAVRRHVHVFVNSSLIRSRESFDRSLLPGDVVSIQPAVSGG